MAVAVLSFTAQLESMDCATCGVTFAAPSQLIRNGRGDPSVSVYCPNGHANVWRKSEADRLREQLAEKEAALQQANNRAALWRSAKEEAERKAIAQKAANTRLKKRVGNGVCPCCKRTFKQLAQHMAHKHPDYHKPTDEA